MPQGKPGVSFLFHSGAIKPQQVKGAQQDDDIQRVPVKLKVVENDVGIEMEIWHFC